jgi:hypothetical protein
LAVPFRLILLSSTIAMKTRLYTVHLLDDASDNGLVLIKEGFCWLAFFFSIPWALFHRMWAVAGAFAILQISLVILFKITNIMATGQAIAFFGLALAFGFLADELRRNALTRQGYYLEEVVLEQNIDSATQRFLDARPELSARMAARS